MWRAARSPYNCGMDTITPTNRFAASTALLQAFLDHDFDQLVDALEPDAVMSALLPGGPREWVGAASIGAAFERWFGATSSFEVAEATAGRIGELAALRWRLRVRADRFGDEAMVVEQQAFAATGPTGRIARISLVCSGFWPQAHDPASGS